MPESVAHHPSFSPCNDVDNINTSVNAEYIVR